MHNQENFTIMLIMIIKPFSCFKHAKKLIFCEVRHGLKKLKLDFSQALRLLQESQFLHLNTWLVSLFISYNTISAIVLDPEKNRVKVFLYTAVLRKSLE